MFNTNKLMAALRADGRELVDVKFFAPPAPVKIQDFVDAATRAIDKVNSGFSTKLDSFPDVGIKGTI